MNLKGIFYSILIWMILPAAAIAQQGHPLVGVWLGDWGPSEDSRNFIMMEMSRIDTTLSGIINPGFPDEATLEVSELDSANWTVHFEAVGNDESSNPVTTVIDGQLENLGSPNRSLSGTWQRGEVSGDFRLTRD